MTEWDRLKPNTTRKFTTPLEPVVHSCEVFFSFGTFEISALFSQSLIFALFFYSFTTRFVQNWLAKRRRFDSRRNTPIRLSPSLPQKRDQLDEGDGLVDYCARSRECLCDQTQQQAYGFPISRPHPCTPAKLGSHACQCLLLII